MAAALFSSIANAGEPTWYSWDEGYKLAREENKPLMVFVHASWCHLCQRMDTRVFTDEEVMALINLHYIPVKFDAEYEGDLMMDGVSYSSGEMLGKLTNNRFRGIPAYIFIPGNLQKKSSLEAGLKDPEEMKALLNKYK